MKTTKIIDHVVYELQANGSLVPIAEVFPNGHHRMVRADVIEPERVEFIDEDKRFPVGTVTLGVGFPGDRKSVV